MAACTSCGNPLAEGARFCPNCGAPVAAAPEERERKVATIVFADLVGSTRLAGDLDPERTRALLERFYDAMAAEIEAAGGTLEKFAGDAVMAVFGAPASLEDHAERALHAAIAMRKRLEELFGDRLELRTGVNTGEVVVGAPREGSSFVTGDPVNVAARLEQGAEPGEVLVGERTVAAARGAFQFGDPRTIEAKGKPGGVEARSLIRAVSLTRPRGVRGLRRAFVGRDRELETLLRAHGEVERSKEPQLVTVLGDAGVGKSTLLREFADQLSERSPSTVRRTGRCLSYGQGITYWPLAEILKQHLRILEDDPQSVVLDRLGSNEILGLALGIEVVHDLHPLAARDRFQDAWVSFLEEIATDRPLLLEVEDLHWAEDQLLDLLERVVRDTTGPVLLIATARPELLEERPGWGARQAGATLELEALSAEDAVRMMDELLGGTLPVDLRDVVVHRAEGNPFFVEELLGTLIDRELLERQNGSWRLAPLPADFAIPDTVHAVVAARVDLLEPPEKQALQAASVIGRVFWAGPVYELVSDAEPDLRVLEERDFIRRRPGSSMEGDREYSIKHALTREVAYGSLPKARRAELHAAFATWLEEALGGRPEDAAILAHHYAESVRPDDVDLAWSDRPEELAALRERALGWLQRAAELAVGRFEIDEGLALLHRAVDLETDPASRSALWRAIARANVFKFDGEAFWTGMLNALEGADAKSRGDIYSVLAFHTATRAAMWKTRPAHDLISGWIDRASDLSDAGSPARARTLIARGYLDPEEEGAAVREATELAESLDDVELRSWAWGARAEEALARGEYEEAYGWAKRRFDLVPTLDDPDHISLIYVFGQPACLVTTRFDEAHEIARAHDDVTARLTPHHRMHAAMLLVDTPHATGDWGAIRDLTARVEAAVAANIATPCASNVGSLLICALANVHLGDDDEARRLERAAEDLGLEGYVFDPRYVALAVARGDVAALERRLAGWRPEGFWDADGVVAWLDALIALDRHEQIQAEAPPFLKPGTQLEPFVLRALGVARGDEAMVRRAVQRFEDQGSSWHVGETMKLLPLS
ncbi:MAG TPA: AAA family ATPase [Actinomycetota bacterium]|nr:AAA family ATPase [Actinomycetota bacterium]